MADSSKPPSTSSGSTPSLFGSVSGANATSQTSNLFGQSSSQTSSSSGAGLFGNTQKSSLFDGASSSPTFGNQSSSGGLFNTGGSGPSSGGGFTFGTKPTGEGIQEKASSNLFGGLSTPNKGSNMPASSQSQTGTLFGASTGNAAALSSALTPTSDKPAFNFGNLSTTPAGPPPASTGSTLFSLGHSAANISSAFGSTISNASTQQPATTTALSSTFGQKSQTPTSSQPSNSLFGAGGSQSTGSTLFGNQNQSAQSSQPSAQPSGQGIRSSLFQVPSTQNSDNQVSKPQESSNSRPMFALPASTSTSQSSLVAPMNPANQGKNDASASSSATTGSNLFANMNSKAKADDKASQQQNTASASSSATPGATTTSSTTTPLFGTAPKSAVNATAPSTSNSLFGTVQSAASNTGSASTSLFGASKPAEAATTSAMQQTGSTGTASANSNVSATSNATTTQSQTTSNVVQGNTTDLGSSTAGPVPTTQSRLKNKSMDDIITRWAADLSKYQKEFQKQADKVTEWDRTLLSNGNAISKLYAKTYQAERDTAEVERQLSIVEGHQDELSHWLDRYEKEVDELIAKQLVPEGTQGPDQERERTFKTAERVSDRLNDMGRDLTSMIDEINEASAAISKTNRPDDPLSQIVRILNGHLSQLQQIDQGTAELQTKVDAARKELSTFSGIRGGANNEALSDFYKSYMRGG